MNFNEDFTEGCEDVPFSFGKQFDQLISLFFDMLVLIDKKGYQHYVSRSCENILGYAPDELRGVSVIEEFVHPQDQEKAREGLRCILDNSANGGTQYRHKHKNGGWVYLEAFGTNQLDNPSVQSVVLNVRDITERKKIEDELWESRRRLKELNATKDRFFTIIGHDLKNPIGNIHGLSNLILEQLESGYSDEVEEFTKMIQHSSKRTLDLLSNLLTWAQSQTGSVQYRPEVLDLRKLTDGVIDILEDIASRKLITLENQIPKGTQLHADLKMMELIIRNLISNGIKFTPTYGKVTIKIKTYPEKVMILVEDTGIGISQEQIDRLLRMDVHYSTKGTEDEGGTGLGLMLCKEFIALHGGQMMVDSQEGQGSTFSFTIPKN